MYRDLLSDAVPEWAGFRVELQAVYLGMPVGISVTPADRWDKPLTKFKDRVAPLRALPIQASKPMDICRRSA